jgi:hypothetical protein
MTSINADSMKFRYHAWMTWDDINKEVYLGLDALFLAFIESAQQIMYSADPKSTLPSFPRLFQEMRIRSEDKS